MEKLTAGLDCDDIAFPFVRELILYLNNEWGMSLKKEDFDTYNLQKVFGDRYFWQTVRKLNGFYRSPYFKEAKPIEGAIEFVDSLRKNYDLHVVTSRPRILRGSTNDFFESFFPGMIKSTHFSKNTACYNGSRKTKAQICKNLNAKILFEDCLEHAIQCAEEGINVILFDNPWNQLLKEPSGIYRVKNYAEAGNCALALVNA